MPVGDRWAPGTAAGAADPQREPEVRDTVHAALDTWLVGKLRLGIVLICEQMCSRCDLISTAWLLLWLKFFFFYLDQS